ncbi:MAG: hypothetical protein ACYCRF_01910 [Acidithiobacillus sp.]
MIHHEKKIIRYGFFPAALLFLFLGLQESAKQEEENANQKNKNAELNTNITKMEYFSEKQEGQLSILEKLNSELNISIKKIAAAAKLDPNRSNRELVNEIIKRLPSSNDNWPALSSDEKAQLTSALKLLHPQSIVVACETSKCKKLADDLNAALRAGGWDSRILHSGGLGITGTSGISLDPSENNTKYLKEAIEKTTNLKVSVLDHSRKNYGNNPAFLVVGTKPF